MKDLQDSAETERSVRCKDLEGQAPLTGLVQLYAGIHKDMVDAVKLKLMISSKNQGGGSGTLPTNR
jgi:hypothetical protein